MMENIVFKTDNALYSSKQIKACEYKAVHHYQFDEYELMKTAARRALTVIQQRFPEARSVAIFCGSGNNAGDGYCLAQLAHEAGLIVTIYQCKAIDELPMTARQAAIDAQYAGVDCQPADEVLDGETDLIVDALLGIGLQGAVYGLIATAIHQINSSNVPVISLDIPSGLHADTGTIMNLCVKAQVTITFVGKKLGLYTLDGPDYCGVIEYDDLHLKGLLQELLPVAWLLSHKILPLPLPTRQKNSHKGDYGHVLIIGGGVGMPGAVALVAKAALRAGAGMVSVATLPEHVLTTVAFIPEAMVWGIRTETELQELIAQASVCVIGPGLGDSDWSQRLFSLALTSQLPMIIDASALRLLATYPQKDDNWILTPHPGEAASLLSRSVKEIQDDRYASARDIQQQYGGVVVLKGCGTIIQINEQEAYVCPLGNPAMATAGMGDVLSGIIAGLCAQKRPLSEAAMLGVWVHAKAGDYHARLLGGRGLLASDVLTNVPKILNNVVDEYEPNST